MPVLAGQRSNFLILERPEWPIRIQLAHRILLTLGPEAARKPGGFQVGSTHYYLMIVLGKCLVQSARHCNHLLGLPAHQSS